MALEGLTTEFTTENLERDARPRRPTTSSAAYRGWVQGEWTVVVVGDASAYADGIAELGIGDVTVVPN